MSDLAEFLLARIAEDESVARKDSADAMVGWRWKHYPREAYEEIQAVTLAHSARVLAKCKADRLIVEQSHALNRYGPGRVVAPELRWVLASLALPYAGHPDYREEWKL